MTCHCNQFCYNHFPHHHFYYQHDLWLSPFLPFAWPSQLFTIVTHDSHGFHVYHHCDQFWVLFLSCSSVGGYTSYVPVLKKTLSCDNGDIGTLWVAETKWTVLCAEWKVSNPSLPRALVRIRHSLCSWSLPHGIDRVLQEPLPKMLSATSCAPWCCNVLRNTAA